MNFISWTFIVAIIAITDSLAFGHDSREILTCHDVRPMKRFGANRALGVWYGFISRANSETAAKSCLKLNLISIGNNTLNSEVSYVDANGTVVSSQSSNQLLGLSQATFLSNKAVTLANGQNATIEIRSTTVYTDYNNILVVFSCGEYPDTRGLLTSYSVFVRSRGFNSLASLSKALDKLDDYVTLSETFSWIKNDATCQN